MFCSFENDPLILRLYGSARSIHPADAGWESYFSLFPPIPGGRQIILVDIDLVHTSCGFGVPYFDYRGERKELEEFAIRKGEKGLREYWKKKNMESMDGKDTGMRKYFE